MRNNIVRGKTHYYSTVKSDRYKLIRHGKIGESKYFFNKKKSTDIKNLNNFQVSVFLKIVYFFSIYISKKNFKNRIVSIWRKYNGGIIPSTPPHIEVNADNITQKLRDQKAFLLDGPLILIN